MAALARQTAAIPDDSVAALVRWFVPRSERLGGRMRWFGRNVKLSSKIRTRRRRQSTNTVVLAGTPASCWSIKSYGRRGGYDVTARRAPALALSSFAPGVFFAHVTVHQSTKGDRRWDRLVAEADRKFPDVVAELIDRGLR
jgi:hypothetical protein